LALHVEMSGEVDIGGALLVVSLPSRFETYWALLHRTGGGIDVGAELKGIV
jgi:hypothetical protein